MAMEYVHLKRGCSGLNFFDLVLIRPGTGLDVCMT